MSIQEKEKRSYEAKGVVVQRRSQLSQAESDLSDALIDEVREKASHISLDVVALRGRVDEIPERLSLDHNGVRRDCLKLLEEMDRTLSVVKDKIGRLKVTPEF